MSFALQTRNALLAAALSLALGSARAHDEPMWEPERVSVEGQAAVNERSLRIAIIRAGMRRNWTLESDAPGEVVLKQNRANKHIAIVKVRYDGGSYHLSYVSSHNLNEGQWAGRGYSRNEPIDPAQRRIHPTYNMWLRNLSSDIASEIRLLPLN